MDKPKVAFYWCSSCGGCEEAVIDLDDRLLDVAEAVEIVLWPAALDLRYRDLEALPDGSVAAAFVNGAVRTSEQEEVAQLLRRKSQVVVALGACAAWGGVPALANLTSREAIFDASYLRCPTVPEGERIAPRTRARMNGYVLELPEFQKTVRRLCDVVEVDYTLPGCPPGADLIAEAVGALLEGRLPEKGAVLAPSKSLCGSCPRNDSKPEEVAIDRIRRVTEVVLDPETCLLAQGVLCMGPATRDGCGAACVVGNMPCSGCYGPVDGCRDQGGKMISALGGLLSGEDPEGVDDALAGLVDPAGTLYRYALSASMLGGAREGDTE